MKVAHPWRGAVSLLALLLLFPLLLSAAEPDWWKEPGTFNPAKAPDDHAVAAIGQAMHLAQRARQYMSRSNVVAGAGGVGAEIDGLLSSYNPAWNPRALRLGQLKYLSAPFWKRLQQLQFPGVPPAPAHPYPWTPTTSDDQDQALATLGQVKSAFAFHLPFGNQAGDFDGDGLTDQQEATLGTNPLLKDTDGDGMEDGWEHYYEFPPTDGQPTNPQKTGRNNDHDGDGKTNGDAFDQGFCPFNKYGYDIEVINNNPLMVDLHWFAVSGVYYELEYSFTLQEGEWYPIPWEDFDWGGPPWDGMGENAEIVIHLGDYFDPLPPECFFRLRGGSTRDSDGDGYSDLFEYQNGTDPNDANDHPPDDGDFDGDGLSNYWEREIGLNPANADSNGNGTPDGLEDADQDGVKNNEDAHPGSAVVAWRKVPESRYIVVPLALPPGVSKARGYDLNDNGQAAGLGVPSVTDSDRPEMRIPILWQSGAVSVLVEGDIDNTGFQSKQTSPPHNIKSSPVRWFAADSSNGATEVSLPIVRSIFIDNNGVITANGKIQANNQGAGWDYTIVGSDSAMRWSSPSVDPTVIGRTVPYTSSYEGSRYDTRISWGIPLPGASIVAEKSPYSSQFKYSSSPTTVPAYHASGVQYVGFIEGISSNGYLTAQGSNDDYQSRCSYIWQSLSSGSPVNAVDPSTIGGVKSIAHITNAPSSFHAAIGGGYVYNTAYFGPGYPVLISDKSTISPWTQTLRLSADSGILSEAFINNNGIVVWNTVTGPPSYYSEPFLWRNGKSHRLQNLLSNQNHIIDKVTALNNHGVILINLAANGGNPERPALLIPAEVAPDVLRVNTDFDEGRLDPATGFALEDASDEDLRADRDSPDGSIKSGELVTKDLRQVWFGINPNTLDASFFDGGTFHIKKLNKTDPDTGRSEPGHVRLWVTQGTGSTGQAWPVKSYDFNTLQPVNLVGLVYGSSATIPGGSGKTYWIEGVKPGKITLEMSFTKGTTDIRYEQTFLIATQQTKDKWLKEIRDQILLQSQGQIDLNHYLPSSGYLPANASGSGTDSFLFHTEHVRAIYDYYGQLFQQWPEKLDWMGAAHMVGATVYAGLSDLFATSPSFSVDRQLMGGQILIYRDLAWQHRAYVASGIPALEWIDTNDPTSINGIAGQGALDLDAWRAFHLAILDGSTSGIRQATLDLVRREQSEVIVPMWTDLQSRSPGFLIVASGEAKNPADPNSPKFQEVVPDGNVSIYQDRDRFSFGWAGSPNGAKGVFPVWWGTTSSSGTPTTNYDAATRLNLVKTPLKTRANIYSTFPPVR